ncbi:helix-turn-helix transcriptional regulator [Sorangium sp. So ce327]|uniref:helix-turn-helix transcriptional regulator n=1 Tax=Sorangium sp. So ce327 TaxID=3133301 RepID=UPI003F62C433
MAAVLRKGGSILNLKAFVEECFGVDAWSRLVAAQLEPDKSVLSSVLPDCWYEIGLHSRINRAFCDMFYDGNLAALETLGRFSAERDMVARGRWMLQYMRPSFIIQFMNLYWRQDESCGHWSTRLVGGEFVATLSGWEVADSVLCRRLLGYIGRMLELCGSVVCATHQECRALGGNSCVFRFRWQHESAPILVSELVDGLSRLPELDPLVDTILDLVHFRLFFPYVEIWLQGESSGELASYRSVGARGSATVRRFLLQVGNSPVGRLDVEAQGDSRQDVLDELIPWLAQMLNDARLSSVRASPLHAFQLKLALARRAWGLTPKETEVLELVLRGHTNQGISRKLRLRISTIEQHVSRILGKSEATSRATLCWAFWMNL